MPLTFEGENKTWYIVDHFFRTTEKETALVMFPVLMITFFGLVICIICSLHSQHCLIEHGQ